MPKNNISLQFHLAASYILELGILDEDLSTFTANMRCAGAIFLLRYLLRKYCQCGQVEVGSGVCRHRRMPLWSMGLYRVIAIPDGAELRAMAYSYATLLHLAKDTRNFTVCMINTLMKYGNCDTSTDLAFHLSFQYAVTYNYDNLERMYIARDEILQSISPDDLSELHNLRYNFNQQTPH